METHKSLISPKQYINRNFIDSNSTGIPFKWDKRNSKIENFTDEPIDLTISPINTNISYQHSKNEEQVDMISNNHIINNSPSLQEKGCDNSYIKFSPRLEAQAFQIMNCSDAFGEQSQYDYCLSKRRKRRKFVYTNEGKLVLVTEDNFQDPQSFTHAKQVEILKAAKSLFSKRTRTLYHWMYPDASKQQIKTTVLTSWDSLAENEKAFYISQVLGRFGLSQSSLMVNPQLGSIKELPPPITKVESQPNFKELQNALTSITPNHRIEPMPPTNTSYLTFEEFEAMRERTRPRRGRPRGNISKKIKTSKEDFQDDPELSQELEKFAIKFNLNKIY